METNAPLFQLVQEVESGDVVGGTHSFILPGGLQITGTLVSSKEIGKNVLSHRNISPEDAARALAEDRKHQRPTSLPPNSAYLANATIVNNGFVSHARFIVVPLNLVLLSFEPLEDGDT